MTTEQMDANDSASRRAAQMAQVRTRYDPYSLVSSEPRVTDQEEHTHYSDRARVICAGGDHESAELWDRDLERIKVREAEKAEQDRIEREDGFVDITRHTEDTLFKVARALRETGHTEADASNTITAILNAGILFREPAPEYDPVPAESGETMMAEEPIEQRLLRAFLNGFREGAERASWGGGNWDHR
jgi:hypothetical protein